MQPRHTTWRLRACLRQLLAALALTTIAAHCLAQRAEPVPKPPAGGAASPRVEVFANSAMYLTNTEVATTVYLLDGLVVLEAELSAGLPTDEAKAMVVAQERIRRMSGVIKARGENAAQGLQQALEYGVDRIPAIVIDGDAIVYGVTDVAQALAIWRKQRGQAALRIENTRPTAR